MGIQRLHSSLSPSSPNPDAAESLEDLLSASCTHLGIGRSGQNTEPIPQDFRSLKFLPRMPSLIIHKTFGVAQHSQISPSIQIKQKGHHTRFKNPLIKVDIKFDLVAIMLIAVLHPLVARLKLELPVALSGFFLTLATALQGVQQ